MQRISLLSSAALSFLFLLTPNSAFAQGGWDVWSVYLRDGTVQTAAPLWSLDEKELRRGFKPGGIPSDEGVSRSLLSYLSNSLRNSEYARKMSPNFVAPPLPKDTSTSDLVIFDDGRRSFGTVMIRPGKSASGDEDIWNPVLVQNGKEYALTSVAHIRMGQPNLRSKTRKLPKKSPR
jgi:hypothetical protein